MGTAKQSYYRINWKRGFFTSTQSPDVELEVGCCGESVIREPYRRVFAPHKDYELIYMLGGGLDITLNGEKLTIEKGDVIFINPGSKLIMETPREMNEWTRYYWVHFYGSRAYESLEACSLETCKKYTVKDNNELFDYYEKMFSEFRCRTSSFDYATSLYMRCIILEVSRSLGERAGELFNSIRYIHAHIKDEISVTTLASMEYLGVSRYREKFKKITGTSPLEYITELRIAKACDLLGRGGMSITEIAESVGYNDRHYFQRAFKKATGTTPAAYKKSIINK